MMAEKHRDGSEMGDLQHAIISDVFEKIRDGDGFFYENPPEKMRLEQIHDDTSVEVNHAYTLAEILKLNGVHPVDQEGNPDDNIWFVGSTAAGRNARYGLFASDDDETVADEAEPAEPVDDVPSSSTPAVKTATRDDVSGHRVVQRSDTGRVDSTNDDIIAAARDAGQARSSNSRLDTSSRIAHAVPRP